jgi:hypothetical protein
MTVQLILTSVTFDIFFKGMSYGHNQEDSPPILHTDHDQSELTDNHSGKFSEIFI